MHISAVLFELSFVCSPLKFIISSSYNPLSRASGKIQYEAEAKPRPSNCILPEAQGSGL